MSFDIYIPKIRYMDTNDPIIQKGSIAGEFKFILRDAMGRPVMETDWQKNLVTNEGLDMMSWHYANALPDLNPGTQCTLCSLGSGTATPAFTDTELSILLGSAGSSTSESYDPFYSTGAPLYGLYRTFKYRFDQGNATGNISEIGLRLDVDGPLFTRALVSPTFDKSSDHILDVFYRIYWYPELADQTGVITLDSVDYDFIHRGCNLDGGQSAFAAGGYVRVNQGLSGFYGGGTCDLTGFGSNLVYPTYNIAGAPNAWMGPIDDGRDPYTPGQHYLDFEYVADITRFAWAEGTGDLRGVHMAGFNWMHKTYFTKVSDGVTGIPKDDTNEFRLIFRFAWDRY